MLVASEVISVPKRDDLMLPLLSFAREKHLGESSDVFNVTWTFSFLIDDMGLSENASSKETKRLAKKVRKMLIEEIIKLQNEV